MRRWIAFVGAVLFTGAAAAQDWRAPDSAKSLKNPVVKAAGIKDGKPSFDANCALCHGRGGRGDGPAAASLNPKPKNLADKGIQGQSDGELFWKISEGRGVMPSWKHLPENQRWSLVQYIRSLAGKR